MNGWLTRWILHRLKSAPADEFSRVGPNIGFGDTSFSCQGINNVRDRVTGHNVSARHPCIM